MPLSRVRNFPLPFGGQLEITILVEQRRNLLGAGQGRPSGSQLILQAARRVSQYFALGWWNLETACANPAKS